MYTPLHKLFDFWLRSLRYEKDFCQCNQNHLRRRWKKFFRWIEGSFRGTKKGGGVPSPAPINPEVIFSDTLVTASRLNNLYGLETWYVQSFRHVKIIQKVLRLIWHFWRIYDVINVGFFRHFAVFGYSKCLKLCRNSWFSHRICILIGSTTLPSLMRCRLFVVKLWRHNCRKNAISSLGLYKMTDF